MKLSRGQTQHLPLLNCFGDHMCGYINKTQIREKYRGILRKYYLGATVASEDHSFLVSIIKNSHKCDEIVGAGIAQITKITHPIYKKECFLIKRIDGSNKIVGFDRLIYSRDMDEVYLAFRFAILQQVYVYRLTHDAENDDDVHHVVPFRRLVHQFLESRGLSLSNIRVKKHPYKLDVWEIVSDDILTAWRTYHKNECDLQLLNKEQHRTYRGDF